MKKNGIIFVSLLASICLKAENLHDTRMSIRTTIEKLNSQNLSREQATSEYQKALGKIQELKKQHLPVQKTEFELQNAYQQNLTRSMPKRAVVIEKTAPAASMVPEGTVYSKKRIAPTPGSQMAQPVGIIRSNVIPSSPPPVGRQPISISRPAFPSQGQPTSLLEQIRQGKQLNPAQGRVLAPQPKVSDQGTQLKEAVEKRLSGLENMQQPSIDNEGSEASEEEWE